MFVRSAQAFAERLELDIANIAVLLETGAISESEADELRARMAGELDSVNGLIAEFSKFL
jgi:hypothetical protein